MTDEDKLRIVRASPERVGAHDFDGWVDLFTTDHVIEDPVGSRPVRGDGPPRRGRSQIRQFWDTFIAHNDIRFEVHGDYIDDLHVVRDVTIHTTMPTGAEVTTPAHLLYELENVDGDYKIRRMAAHWEVVPAMLQTVRPHGPQLRGLLLSTRKLLAHQGLGGTVVFSAAPVRSTGRRGKRALVAWAARVQDEAAPRDLTKIIAAGDTVSARCTIAGRPGVVLAHLDRRTKSVDEARVYTSSS